MKKPATLVVALVLALSGLLAAAPAASATTCTAPYSKLLSAGSTIDHQDHCVTPSTNTDANGYTWHYGPAPPYGHKWR
jgi:hypothetical protein